MFTRVNFLLGTGLLILLLFYFVFRFAVLLPLGAIAPGWVTPVAGAAVLLSVGLTVQFLSKFMGNMAGVASYERGPDALGIASQAALVCGHGALAYAAAVWFGEGQLPATSGLLLITALYAAGVAIGILEWRQRKRTAA